MKGKFNWTEFMIPNFLSIAFSCQTFKVNILPTCDRTQSLAIDMHEIPISSIVAFSIFLSLDRLPNFLCKY